MEKKRLITRSDFDGLVCAMLLRELDMIDEIKFVHPKDVQDGKVDINENDITTNLPFDPRVGLAFDHHESELVRNNMEAYGHKFICLREKSAARVVYNYYGGAERFKTVNEEIMQAVEKIVGIPEGQRAFAVFPFGYPAQEKEPQDRFDSGRIHWL